MLTLGTLKNELKLSHVNKTIGARINDWVYWVMCDILAANEYWWNKKVGTLNTVAGTALYFLNHRTNMKQLKRFYNTTNNGVIDEVPLEDIYSADPTPTETGTPYKWAFVQQAEVQAVASAAAIAVVSSSNAADLSQKVVIRGKVSGIERIEELSLNGTSSVNGTLVWDAGEIESVSLSDACAGVVTLSSNSTTIVSIPPGYLRIQCPLVRFHLVPGSVFELNYIFYQKAVRPSSDNEIIDFPDEAYKALRYGLAEIAYYNNGDVDFSLKAYQQYNEAKKELHKWSQRSLNMNETKDYCPTPSFGARWPDKIIHTVT